MHRITVHLQRQRLHHFPAPHHPWEESFLIPSLGVGSQTSQLQEPRCCSKHRSSGRGPRHPRPAQPRRGAPTPLRQPLGTRSPATSAVLVPWRRRGGSWRRPLRRAAGHVGSGARLAAEGRRRQYGGGAGWLGPLARPVQASRRGRCHLLHSRPPGSGARRRRRFPLSREELWIGGEGGGGAASAVPGWRAQR